MAELRQTASHAPIDPLVERALNRARGSGGFRAWQGLDFDRRLELVECALSNGEGCDGLPIAL